MYAAGIEALATAERDPGIRAVVLTGADRFFCAGGNLNRLLDNRSKDPSYRRQHRSARRLGHGDPCFDEAGDRSSGTPRPARAFARARVRPDRRRARREVRDVIRACRPDARWRRFVVHRRALPRAIAAEILFEGKPVAAERLHTLGVVNRLAVPGAALTDALAWADALAGISPNALTRIKSLLDDATTQPLDAHLATERDHFVASLHHADGRRHHRISRETPAPLQALSGRARFGIDMSPPHRPDAARRRRHLDDSGRYAIAPRTRRLTRTGTQVPVASSPHRSML